MPPLELKDISTMSGGTFVLPAFGAAGIKQPNVIVSPVEAALQNLARVHNAVHTDPSQHADVAALRSVYRRGASAYKPRSKTSSSRRQHAMKRVRGHLSHLATGERPSKGFTNDDDLLPASHPHACSTAAERKALIVIEGRPEPQLDPQPVSVNDLARLTAERKWLGFDTLEVKAAWNPDKHPRDSRGRFAHLGALVDALIGGKHQSGTIVGIRGQSVRVRTADGTESTVKAADTTVTGNVGPHMSLAEHAKAHSDAERHVKAMSKANHPETAAWQTRHDELGAALKERAAGKSGDEVAAEMRGDKPAAASDARVSIRSNTYQGREGHTITGRDARGRRVDVFVPGDRAAADRAAANIRAGRSAFKDDPADTRPDGQAWGSGYSPSDPRNDPAYDRYVHDLNSRLDQAKAEVGDTESLYRDPATGAYSDERQAMHDRILQSLLDSYQHVPRERRALVVAGPSGAGKSSLIRARGHEFGVTQDENGNPANFATVNPDDIKEMIAAHGGLPAAYDKYGFGEGETADLTHEESSHIAKRLKEALLAKGSNILLDGTFAGGVDKNVAKVRELRGRGYSAHGVLVNGDVETSLARAGSRHTGGQVPQTGTQLPGRYVPLDVIAAQRPTGHWSGVLGEPHKSVNAENFEAARPAFDGGVRIYDNSQGDAKLMYSEEPGTLDEPAAPLDAGRLQAVQSAQIPADGTVPAAIASSLQQAQSDDKPRYLTPGPSGMQVGPQPTSGAQSWTEVMPTGQVTRFTRQPDGSVTRDVMPTADVESIVDHYAPPAQGGPAPDGPAEVPPMPADLVQGMSSDLRDQAERRWQELAAAMGRMHPEVQGDDLVKRLRGAMRIHQHANNPRNWTGGDPKA